MKALLLSAVIVLGLSPLLNAGPLDLKQISGDAKWVVHVDMDSLRESTVVQKAHELAEPSHRETRDRALAIAGLFGANPRQHLHGITLYGGMLGKPEGVMIVHSDFNRGLLEGTIKLAFYRTNVLVVGSTEDELERGLDVLDGKRPGLAWTRNTLQGL